MHKENQTEVVVMHNPCEINQNQLLLVRFLNLGSDDVIVLGMENLSFNIKLSSADPARVLVSNMGKAIIKKLPVKSEENIGCGQLSRVCMLPRPVEDGARKVEHSETRHNP